MPIHSIPDLDISELILNQDDPATITKFATHLSAALSSIGFVSLIGHGVSKETVRDAMNTSRVFFEDLDEAQKEAVASSEEKQQGYVKPGMEIFDQSENGEKARK